jgi:hypothetical protein
MINQLEQLLVSNLLVEEELLVQMIKLDQCLIFYAGYPQE